MNDMLAFILSIAGLFVVNHHLFSKVIPKMKKKVYLLRNGIDEIGIVVDQSEKTSADGGSAYCAVINFKDADNNDHTLNTEYEFNKPPRIGIKARVKYDKFNPDNAIVVRSDTRFQIVFTVLFYLVANSIVIAYILKWVKVLLH